MHQPSLERTIKRLQAKKEKVEGKSLDVSVVMHGKTWTVSIPNPYEKEGYATADGGIVYEHDTKTKIEELIEDPSLFASPFFSKAKVQSDDGKGNIVFYGHNYPNEFIEQLDNLGFSTKLADSASANKRERDEEIAQIQDKIEVLENRLTHR